MDALQPRAGLHYPRSAGEFQSWFATDADGFDRGTGIAVDSSGAAYLTGETDSTAATFPETVGPFLTYGGGTDAFVAKFTEALCQGAAVTILGTAGADTITGSADNDVILGLGGNDVIDGAGGDDTICAGEGDDTVIGGLGGDSPDGEGGTDTASFLGTNGVLADLAAGTATGQGSDALVGFENLTGSSNADTLRGDSSANVLRGGRGADRIWGRGGKDRLVGGNGRDRMAGGGANDRLFGGQGGDRLNGGEGKGDRCSGGAGTDAAMMCEKVTGVP